MNPTLRIRPGRPSLIHAAIYGLWIVFCIWVTGFASRSTRAWILEIEVFSDSEGVSVLYADTGGGFTAAVNAQFPLIDGVQTLHFPLPPRPVKSLRWDPLASTSSNPAHIAIYSISLRDPTGKRTHIGPEHGITPLSGLDQVLSGKHSAIFRIPHGTNDPNLLLNLPSSAMTNGVLPPPQYSVQNQLILLLIAILCPALIAIFRLRKTAASALALAALVGSFAPSTTAQAQNGVPDSWLQSDDLKSWSIRSEDDTSPPEKLPLFAVNLNTTESDALWVSDPFECPSRIQMFLECGRLPSGFAFRLSRTSTADESGFLDLVPRPQTKRDWRLLHWDIPREWRGKQVTLSVLSDQWADSIRFTPPLNLYSIRISASVGSSSFLLWLAGIPLHFILLCIPGWAVALVLIRKPALAPCFAFPIAWVFTLAIQYPILWASFLHPEIGVLLSWAILCTGSWILVRHSAKALRVWKRNSNFRDQIALFALSAFTVVAAGCLTGGWDDSLAVASSRYLKQMLPADQLLPMLFADRLQLGMPLKPFFLEWLSSDRPPLPSAPILFQYPFFTEKNTQYHILSILLQASVIPCAHCLLRAIGAGRLLASGISASLAMSGTFLLHSFYVWPKSLPAGLLIVVAALLFGRDPARKSLACRKPGSLIVGLATALAFLSHGGSFFAAFPMFAIWAMIRPVKHIPYGLLALVPFIILMLPWTLYQKHYDPPGDRLLKWHLAGIPELTSEPFSDAVVRRYKDMSFKEWIGIRKTNLRLLWGDWALTFHNLHPLQTVMGFPQIRLGSFLHHFQSLGIWLLGYLAAPWAIFICLRRRQSAIPLLFLVSISGLLLWTCLIFRSGQAIIHHGSLFFQFVGMILGAWCIHMVSSRLLRMCFVLNALLWFVIWVWPHWWVAHLPHSRYDTLRPDTFALILLIGTLSAWLAFLSLHSHYTGRKS